MTDKVATTGKRIANAEPVSRLHSKTNLDSALVATVCVEVARSFLLVAPVIAGIYVVVWIVLAVKTRI